MIIDWKNGIFNTNYLKIAKIIIFQHFLLKIHFFFYILIHLPTQFHIQVPTSINNVLPFSPQVRPAMPGQFTEQLARCKPVMTEPLFKMWKETELETTRSRVAAIVKMWAKRNQMVWTTEHKNHLFEPKPALFIKLCILISSSSYCMSHTYIHTRLKATYWYFFFSVVLVLYVSSS